MFSSYKLLTMSPKVLVGCCSDDNYPFAKFLENELGLQEGYYFPLRIPGGLAPLAYQEELPAHFEVVKSYMEVALESRPSINRLIVMSHELCAFYRKFLPESMGNEMKDLPRIAEIATQLFPHRFSQVTVFHALPTKNSEVEFKKLTVGCLQMAR